MKKSLAEAEVQKIVVALIAVFGNDATDDIAEWVLDLAGIEHADYPDEHRAKYDPEIGIGRKPYGNIVADSLRTLLKP